MKTTGKPCFNCTINVVQKYSYVLECLEVGVVDGDIVGIVEVHHIVAPLVARRGEVSSVSTNLKQC